MQLIDSHCHLDDDRYDTDRDDIIARARMQGVNQIVLPATTASRWGKVKQIAEEYEGVYPAYGLHPMFIRSMQLFIEQLQLAKNHALPVIVHVRKAMDK
ncbi:PREDICTED: uncharacterized deoxyribonuclease YjjV-like, partial [Priapulus caudatus]|uniref:Uncharacterized deoxyribonuclease YjjV-like n=1 Tax=Priapulus caudatus TaxID=37621 RepID=A0ABM1F7K3_PRICU